MKLEAADDGAPVLMQTVGSLTVRPSINPTGWSFEYIDCSSRDLELTLSAVVIRDELDYGFADTVAGLGLKRGVPDKQVLALERGSRCRL